jgi:prolyl oligopeptidase
MMLGFRAAWPQKHVSEGPPKTRVDDVRETIHGVEVSDPYRWLEERGSPETEKWIEEQNKYTEAMIGSWPGRDAIRARLTELMKVDWVGMPAARNGRYFYVKRDRDQELPVICMRKGLEGKDEVLIDPHPMSADRTTSVGILDVSEDGTLMAYSVRQGGQDEVVVKLLDLEKRKELPDGLPRARYFDCCLKPDKKGLYYSRHGAEGSRIYYHQMGTDATKDLQVFGEGYGPDKGISVALSEDGRYLLITVWHGSAAEKTELYYQDIVRNRPVLPIVNDVDARFVGEVGGDHLFLWTNWEAPKGRILRVDLNRPAREHWREVIPESDAVIEGFSLAGGRLFVNYLRNVVSRVAVFEPDGKHVCDIPLPAMGTIGSVAGRWTSDEGFFSFSSFHIPSTTYRYRVAEGDLSVWWRLEVPLDSDSFEVKQVWYKSKDGTSVPMFLVHRKGIKLDGSNPALLTGYGGFNASLTPWFSAVATVWVENGGVFAVANLRGGGEFGEEWHSAGMQEKKQNVFDDFLAAAEWLIANRYTKPSKLAISGGSNGGLLVGAALTQRPDLFEAVVCRYPLLDMIRYHKFLVAELWVAEYGSSDDPAQFKYLHAYSPYHKVKQGTKYPAVLFITGDGDTRVAPLHARKMAALLQSATASNKPILLRYETKAGHSGGQPLGKQIEDAADELTFLFWQLGVEPGSRPLTSRSTPAE